MVAPPLNLFATIYGSARLLGHFLRHYQSIGVTHFFMAVGDDLRGQVERDVRDHPVTLVCGLNVADSVAGTAAVSAMRSMNQGIDEWVAIVDLDEFIERESLPAIIDAADLAGANVVRGIMHDRFTVDGRPSDFAPDADLSTVFPVKSRFIREVMKACDHKGVLVKGRLTPGPGAAHHWFEGEHAFSEVLEISHYKWIGGAIDRLRRSLEAVQAAGITWAPEYQRALDHFEAHDRFDWEAFGGMPADDFSVEPPAAHCASCGGAISEAERDYSSHVFERPLCRADQAPLRRSNG